MKLSMNTDFTKMPRAGALIRAADLGPESDRVIPFDLAVLDHEERHLRRRVIQLIHGDKILVDLPEAVQIDGRDVLVLDDGRHAEIIAAEEEVYDIRAKDAVHLAELAWHIGNRHLAAQIEEGRIVILRDHVIKAMLEGLGATVSEVSDTFHPVRGAYSGGHSHGPQPDAHGRMPGDPHYGHSHGPGEHHHHDHAHDHHPHDHGHHGHDHHDDHGERDAFGRMPGDPHYGHNHA